MTSSRKLEVSVEMCCSKCVDNVEMVAHTTPGVSQVSIDRWKSLLTFTETPSGILDEKKFVKRLKKATHDKKVLPPRAPAVQEKPKPKPTPPPPPPPPPPAVIYTPPPVFWGHIFPFPPYSRSPFIPNPFYLQHPVRCHQCYGYSDVVCANCGRNSNY